MSRSTRALLTLALLSTLLLPALATAQVGPPINEAPAVEPLKLSGPRFGLTYLPAELRQRVADEFELEISPVITQFGWQWETRFFSNEGMTGVSEWVLLVGGLEQNHFIPSLSWILGVRSQGGTEFGVGPNLSVSGTAIVFAGGVTVRSGPIYFPVNLALVPSTDGVRVSTLVGFNMRPSR
jgi:hypothetical protein